MPVTRTFRAHSAFGASHQLDGHPVCNRLHGHQYTVDLHWAGDPIADAWGFPVVIDRVSDALRIVAELQSRHLNDMIPTGPPSVSGIAAYLLERTRILGVIKVEVSESDTNVTGEASHLDR